MSEQKRTTTATFDEEAILRDYRRAHKGTLTDAQIEEGAKSLSEALKAAAKQTAAQTKYAANATIATTFAWVHIGVTVSGGKSCIGDGGGVFGLGGGGFWGDVYTDDIERLYRDTVSFQVNLAVFY